MFKKWLYKQKNYSDSFWNKFQDFLAFHLIPFVVAAILTTILVVAIFSPFIILSN